MERQLQEQGNIRQELHHFTEEFIKKHIQNAMFLEVSEQIKSGINPYIIIQGLIEKLAHTTKQFQVDMEKYNELER